MTAFFGASWNLVLSRHIRTGDKTMTGRHNNQNLRELVTKVQKAYDRCYFSLSSDAFWDQVHILTHDPV